MPTPSWSSSQRLLLHGGTIYSPTNPFATAMLVDGDTIAWLGEDSAAAAHRDAADAVIDLRGALVTPGFVDAHVHATSTGLALTGLDLSGTRSLGEALALVEARAQEVRGGVILGHGWDETRWPEGRPPTREEIDRATWGSVVYLSRVDVHSAVVSGALVAMNRHLTGLDGYDGAAPLTRQAHQAARQAAYASLTPLQTAVAQRAMRARAAELGIVAAHEMAGPTISGESDLAALLALAAAEPGPLMTGYWGELAADGGIERARAIGAFAVGGDLSVDGALGSRTARLCAPYTDAGGSAGAQYITEEQITEHLVATTEDGLQGGFHVIGDGASAAVVAGLLAAAERLGPDRIRAAGHRIEHAEMLTDDHVDVLSRLGVTASMQPMFDGLWGGPGRMYEARLGYERAAGMNRIADLVGAGVLVAFGSDAPVTELGPWAAVRAAVEHTNANQRLSARAAFSAHTRAGWRAVGDGESGVLTPGAPAHYAAWSVEDVVVQAPDHRLAAWSTDPRSGTPGLPALGTGIPLPRCLRTVVWGRTVHDSGDLEPA